MNENVHISHPLIVATLIFIFFFLLFFLYSTMVHGLRSMVFRIKFFRPIRFIHFPNTFPQMRFLMHFIEHCLAELSWVILSHSSSSSTSSPLP